jgi:hypothetical protein
VVVNFPEFSYMEVISTIGTHLEDGEVVGPISPLEGDFLAMGKRLGLLKQYGTGLEVTAKYLLAVGHSS